MFAGVPCCTRPGKGNRMHHHAPDASAVLPETHQPAGKAAGANCPPAAPSSASNGRAPAVDDGHSGSLRELPNAFEVIYDRASVKGKPALPVAAPRPARPTRDGLPESRGAAATAVDVRSPPRDRTPSLVPVEEEAWRDQRWTGHEEGGRADGAPLPVAHVFAFRDRRFVLDIRTSTFFAVDEETHQVARACTHFSGEDRDGVLRAVGDRVPEARVDAILQELDVLRHHGFFVPEELDDDATIDAKLDRHMARKPRAMTLVVAESCNLGCKYCYAEEGNFGRPAKLMSRETARLAVDQFLARTRGTAEGTIVFFGGEPLLNFDVVKFVVEYALERGQAEGKTITFSITTNGTIMTEEIARFLAKHRFGMKLSIDGDRETHDRMRYRKDGRGSYDQIVANLRILKRYRRSISARATLTRHNTDTIGIEAHLKGLGFTRVGFGYSHGTSFAKAPWDLRDDDLARVHDQDVQRADEILRDLEAGAAPRENPYARMLTDLHTKRSNLIRCGAARGNTAVTVDGSMYPCHRYPGLDAYKLGNVRDGGADPEKVRAYLADYFEVKKGCFRKCFARHLCGGPCPWYVAHPSGKHLAPDLEHCRSIRHGIEFGIWFYTELLERFPVYLRGVVEPAATGVPAVRAADDVEEAAG